MLGRVSVFLTTLPLIFNRGGVYNQPEGISSLHYIALGVGITGCSQANARTIDRIYAYFKNKNGGVGKPEFRVRKYTHPHTSHTQKRLPTLTHRSLSSASMVPGSIILPAGMFLAGWSAQAKLHWIVTDIGIALVGGGIILVFQNMQIYVVDTFTLHAASALAAVSCLRSLFGFAFPLFAPEMYAKLGFGKGNTILACLAIVLGVPA